MIRGNRIGGMKPDTGMQAIGISSLSQGALQISDNVIYGEGDAGSIGVLCANTLIHAVTSNDVYDFATPFVGCDSGTGNVSRP